LSLFTQGIIKEVDEVIVNAPPFELVQEWNFTSNSIISGTPTLFDLYNDSTYEVIFGTGSQGLYCYDHEGNETWNYNDYTQTIRDSPLVIDTEGDFQPNVIFGQSDSVRFINGTDGSYMRYTRTGYASGALTIADFEGDGEWEIISSSSSTTKGIFCINSNGTIRWQYTGIGANVNNGPIAADCTGSNEHKIFFTSHDSSIYCINETGDFKWSQATNSSIYSSPAFINTDGNSDLEVVVTSTDGYVYCYEDWGFLSYSYNAKDTIYASPSVADLDGDGNPEVIIVTQNGTVFCLDNQLNYLWHYSEPSSYVENEVAIADVDGDDSLEIVVNFVSIGLVSTTLRVLTNTGIQDANMYFTTNNYAVGSPVVADIDNDNKMEIVFGTGNIGDSSGILFCLGTYFTFDGKGPQWTTQAGSMFRTGTFDADGDCIDNLTEELFELDDNNADYDSDQIQDGYELFYYHTNPSMVDTDFDNLSDHEEITLGVDGYITNPNDADSDDDLLNDEDEYLAGTNPNDSDSDDDGLLDGEELISGTDGYITDPLDADSDDDGLNDGEEATYGTNPNDEDTDDDGFTDNEEIIAGTDPLDENDYPTNTTTTPPTTPTNAGSLSFGLIILSIFSTIGIFIIVRRKR
jgi:hypothetical protein